MSFVVTAVWLGCSTPPAPGAPSTVTAPTLLPETLPEGLAYTRWFDRHVDVFGVRILAAPEVPEASLVHAATITAEYLDNDEDGGADVPAVVDALSQRRALLVMFATADDLESSGIFGARWTRQASLQDLYAEETAPPDAFDASLEEVLHLLQNYGYANRFPDVAPVAGSPLAQAMDLARGGHFEQVPASYPPDAWYHYDDRTCDYGCMATEYFYWALTSLLDLQSTRCGEIDVEWELCTPEAMRSGDPTVTELLQRPELALPTRGPDGVYLP